LLLLEGWFITFVDVDDGVVVVDVAEEFVLAFVFPFVFEFILAVAADVGSDTPPPAPPEVEGAAPVDVGAAVGVDAATVVVACVAPNLSLARAASAQSNACCNVAGAAFMEKRDSYNEFPNLSPNKRAARLSASVILALTACAAAVARDLSVESPAP
jgi:hypothetical protein